MKTCSSASTYSRSLLVGFEQILERRSFVPPVWLRGPHLQTLGASLAKRKYSWGWTDSQQQFLNLSDGSRIMVICIWKCSSAPTMVAVHGMGGSSQSTYMQGLSHKAHREGWTRNKMYQSLPELMLRYKSAAFLIRAFAALLA